MYANTLLKNIPISQFSLHEDTSELVREMNIRLADDSFWNFYEQFPNKYFLIEADIHYPTECQSYLSNFVPTVRRTEWNSNLFSSYQEHIRGSLGLKFCTRTALNLSDFADQTISVSLEYSNLLHQLNVQVVRVRSVCTAYAAPILRDLMSQILRLKSQSKNGFSRNLFKLIG